VGFQRTYLEITCFTSLNTCSYSSVISVIDVCIGLEGTVSFRIIDFKVTGMNMLEVWNTLVNAG
jgi:hypothetical protein